MPFILSHKFDKLSPTPHTVELLENSESINCCSNISLQVHPIQYLYERRTSFRTYIYFLIIIPEKLINKRNKEKFLC